MRFRLGAVVALLSFAMLGMTASAAPHHRKHHHKTSHHRVAKHRRRVPDHDGTTSGTTAAGATGSTAGTPPPATPIQCPPPGADVLAASSTATVYAADGKVYGCATGGSATLLLGAAMPSCAAGASGVDPVTVAGDIAAYALTGCGVDTSCAQVVVRRLNDGAQLLDTSATTAPRMPEGERTVASIVAKSDGAIAWIGRAGQVFAPNTETEVIKYDAGGQTVLDSGSGIDPSSLSLDGSTLSWSDGGTTDTATLN